MDRYLTEIEQLRLLGFAEGLFNGAFPRSLGIVARLECGRIGLAVEFFEPDPVATYSVVALNVEIPDTPGTTLYRWDNVVQDIRRRMPLNDDD